MGNICNDTEERKGIKRIRRVSNICSKDFYIDENYLVIACEEGDLETVKELLSGYLKINYERVHFQHTLGNSKTALNAACKKGYTEIVELLLGYEGIDVNSATFEPPLKHACCEGYVDIVKLLLSNPNIDVNKCDPLKNAIRAKSNSIEITKLLLSRQDLDINKSESIYTICKYRYQETEEFKLKVIKMLLSRSDLDLRKDRPIYGALRISATDRPDGYISLVKELLYHPTVEKVTKDTDWLREVRNQEIRDLLLNFKGFDGKTYQENKRKYPNFFNN